MFFLLRGILMEQEKKYIEAFFFQYLRLGIIILGFKKCLEEIE